MSVVSVPVTPLGQRLRSSRGSTGARLRAARELVARPEALIDDLLESAAVVARLGDPQTRFVPARAILRRDLSTIAHRERAPRTEDFAFWLAHCGRLVVAGHPLLECEPVDRELLAARAYAPSGPSQARRSGAVRVDLLLVNTADRTPVVAEVKIGRDGDAFLAVLQALTGLTHMAGPDQYAHMCQRYPAAHFTRREHPPPMDACVICVDTDWRTGQRGALLHAAKDIACAVSASPRTAALVRRVTLLAMARRPGSVWEDAVRL